MFFVGPVAQCPVEYTVEFDMTPSEIDQLLVKKAKDTHTITKQFPAAAVSFVVV